MASTLNIWFYPYHVRSSLPWNAKQKESIRQGLLLKFKFNDGLVGYSSYQDLSSHTPKKDPKKMLKPGPQWEQAKIWAYQDAWARRDSRHVLEERRLPESHYLIQDILATDAQQIKELKKQGFTCLKVKLGRAVFEELEKLHSLQRELSSLHLRLDFNSTLNEENWQLWQQMVSLELGRQIEFIEDPLPWNKHLWSKSQFPLALDFEQPGSDSIDSVSTLICKPALGEEERLVTLGKPLVYTHLMDHPLGQVGAIYSACRAGVLKPGGFMAIGFTDDLGFSEELQFDGPFLQQPKGTGFGFDERLRDLAWQSL